MADIIGTDAFVAWCDAVTAIYLKARGSDPDDANAPTNANEFGLGVLSGTWGATALAGDAIDAVVQAVTDEGEAGIDAVVALATPARNLRDRVNVKIWANFVLLEPMSAIESHVVQTNGNDIASLDAYLTFLNTGDTDKWQALMPPAYGEMMNYLKGAMPAVNNLWYEILQGTQFTNGMGKLVVGTGYTDGQAVDTDLYCGGFPYIKVASVTGTGVITVTGDAYDPSTKTVSTDRTWVYTLASATPGTYALVPGGASAAPANSLIVNCKTTGGIAVDAGILAGTMYVEAHRPTGRAAFSY